MAAIVSNRFWLASLLLLIAATVAIGAEPGFDDILGGLKLKNADGVGAAGAKDPEQIVTVSAQINPPAGGGPATLSITAEIAPPWHTYSTTQKPSGAVPTEIELEKSGEYRVGEFRPNRPPSAKRELGLVLETFDSQVTWQAPLELSAGVDLAKLKISGELRAQVCSDSECLQPASFPFTAVLDAAAAKTAEGSAEPTGIYAPEGLHVRILGSLQPASAAPGATVNLLLTAEPTQGWHTYALADKDPNTVGSKPTLIVLTNTAGLPSGRTKANLQAVKGEPLDAKSPPPYYYPKPVTWTTPITIPKDAKPGTYPIEGLIGYQTCSDAGCDQPKAARFAATLTVGGAAGQAPAPLAFSDAKYGEAAKAAAKRPVQASGEKVIGEEQLSSLPWIILLSLGGGFILNFMPCVLPVIGLKILSFAEQAGRSRGQIFALNAWYSLGMLTVFFVLAALASGASLGFRQENLSWGEQFSSTTFNVVMVSIVFVMALSFLGVWEIPIPGFVGSGSASEVAARNGAFGAFAKGVLTTVLATPCSGPLLGAVFGYTLNQTPLVTFTIFGSIGIGMAFPYLLIGAFPSLISWLPKPGGWMNTFKEAMGFLMLGTIVFFFTFMNRDYVVPTFAFMIGLWAACWWIGRTSLVETLARRMRAWVQGSLVAAAVGYLAFTFLVPHASIIPWKSFSPSELARLTGEGNTVMIEFTAEWCPNCKFNMYRAIETEDVRTKLQANNVVPLLADWTDGSSDIKKTLESLGSNSIPLLAIFPADRPTEPIVLHGILTKEKLIAAIEQAGPSKGGEKELTASMR